VLNMLISTSELNKKLHDDNLLIIDARSWHDYSDGHIPGAVNLDLFAFHWADTSREGMKDFNRQMTKLLSSVGVSYDKFIVFYDIESGIFAARGVWLLEYFSHKKVAMLDGGIGKWKKDKYPLEKKSNSYKPTRFKPKINAKVLATYGYVRNRLSNPKVKIVDARNRDEYTGKWVRAARGGHIPDATHVDWKENLGKDGSFKTPDALKKLYRNIGKGDEVICYCQGGYRAANDYLALKKLGYKNVRVYLASWYEWGNMLDLPVEK
jgi:thiosulfate/3-mercaptopyruvate sulfurtransferase